jgi:hypothetical protein
MKWVGARYAIDFSYRRGEGRIRTLVTHERNASVLIPVPAHREADPGTGRHEADPGAGRHEADPGAGAP